ncbi:MAG: acyl-protein synthetase LuxE [Elusimicrobia bacterium]|nr:acyl-protein synthetase LuxE [Elusimicrobiota bacterium]
MRFPSAERLCRVQDPHRWTREGRRLMVEACREFARFHARRSADIAALYRRRGFEPDSIRTEADLARIPMLGVTAMKRYLLTSLPRERAALRLTSSGTRGQKTQIWFDADSLARVQSMLTVQWEGEGLVSDRPTNYLMFVYDPAQAKDLGIAFSDKNQQRFAPPARTFYALTKDERGEWRFRLDEALARLREYAEEGKPVRLFGMPGFVFEAVSALREPVRLPAGSWLVTGGGWKAAEDKKVSRADFRRLVTERLGLPGPNIRDAYGMAEHSAPYIDCARHRFHVPVFNRVLVRDPVTLDVVAPGEPGLLELITPFNAMIPNLAILSTDLGRLDAGPCPCGYESPTFSILGRGGLAKHKGCALHAGEIVTRQAAGASR